ncbi:ATP-dependent DNA helicase II subunit 1 [Malassezia sp. CBS 17886]|nr:ATP-dependent DNA helicase II subunit 1 [Malassezia sp. CBS 17886]
MEDAGREEAHAVPWESYSHRDVVLFAIDAGQSMHVRDSDGAVPLVTALRAAARLMEIKLVSSPKGYVGVMLWNTALSRMTTVSKSGFCPHTVEYVGIRQVDVPTTYTLQRLVDAASADSERLPEEMRAAPAQTSVAHVLANALHLLSAAGKSGTRRVFLVTNNDDPCPGRDMKRAQKACIDKMKDYYRRGVDLEPFFISGAQPFRVNVFYADILGVYDDGLVDDALRPWRLRQMQDQNVSKRKTWESGTKFAELDEQLGGREMPKRVLFDLLLDLGPLRKGEERKSHAAGHWRIHVKGYALVAEATKEFPVRVTSYGREDPDDLYEVVAHTELRDAAGERVPSAQTAHLFHLGGTDDSDRSQIVLSEEEVKRLREAGCAPGIRLLGFRDAGFIQFHENIKHAYFLYPSDLEHPGSKRVFAALLQTMLAKQKIALCVYMPRPNVIPSFAALLPQAEEVDEDGNQVVPPGLNLLPLPYADDMRDAPDTPSSVPPTDDEVARARGVIESFLRREPFNPDVFVNPALAHHYDVLKAIAFGRDIPAYCDSILPDCALIRERSLQALQAWNAAINSDDRLVSVADDPASQASWDPARSKEIRARCEDGAPRRM